MAVIMFQPRFAEKIKDGSKLHTIRPVRKRPIKRGDKLSLRRWSGTPYRSSQVVLREAFCLHTATVSIYRRDSGSAVCKYAMVIQTPHEFTELAKRDGFESSKEMVDWFESTHGLPFDGILIQWRFA